MLVYLALEARRRPVSRDSLIDLLWPEVDRDRGAHSLSQALSSIRGRLGSNVVTRGGDGVRLARDLTTDLDLVCAGAATVPHGSTPLEGADAWAGAEFAHWVDAARARCLERARTSLLDHLKSARAAGSLTQVRDCAVALYEVDPLSDAAVQAITERCLVEGDRTAAIRLLRSHLVRTQEELGCDPHPELARLLARLESGDRSVVGPESFFAAAARLRPEPFVGREEDLERLEGVWSEARAGVLRTYLVTGPAGIGKTSLVRRFARSVAARTWPSLVVACQEMGQNIPFAAVSDLIFSLSREPAAAGTDPAWLAEASRVTPGLRSVYPGIPEPPPAPAESVRLRVAESIMQMMDAVGEGAPVLLVLDDVQHLDPASRDVLHVLLRRLDEMPLMLVGTCRLSAHQRLTVQSESPGGLTWHEKAHLAPLSKAETLELAQELARGTGEASDAASAAALAAELAQGNPYLAEMLVSDWRQNPDDSLIMAQRRGDGASAGWHPPETMRRAFARQYQGLSGDAQHMVHLLSVAGRAIAGGEAATLLGLEESEID
ncbi:MAG: AAA family ATPase, partial [Gemmatimonadales bacterium]